MLSTSQPKSMGPSTVPPMTGRPPLGLRWRGSYWFSTFVVGLGVATDLLIYSIIIPVMPFQLEHLGYTRVSALMGWMLFAYSAGLAISTIPIAVFSERYNARRTPLIAGLLILIGSQIMLMEAPNYPVMCIARILQGVGSSMVWVVGLAYLCDATPKQIIGRQLGIAMSGLSLGLLIGPPVGGALYTRFGYRGPFIFGLIVTLLDLIGRLLMIEPKDAIPWGFDPTIMPGSAVGAGVEQFNSLQTYPAENTGGGAEQKDEGSTRKSPEAHPDTVDSGPTPKPLSLVAVMIKLSKSSRALVAIIITFTYGVVYTSQEPALPLHLQNVWGLNPSKVGLVFLAAVIPTLFSSPLTGWYSDRKGSEWITFLSLLLSLPWWGIVVIRGPLALFVVAFAAESFFTSGVISPLTAELAAVSRGIKGVGYAHVYGAFNLAYGIGSAIGPIVGGQLYDRLDNGWLALCLVAVGLLAACIVLAFGFTGKDPLLSQLKRRLKPGEEEKI